MIHYIHCIAEIIILTSILWVLAINMQWDLAEKLGSLLKFWWLTFNKSSILYAVISTLLNFVNMFKKAREENIKLAEAEKKKAEKEKIKSSPAKRDLADPEKSRLSPSRKESDLMFSPHQNKAG